MFRKFSFIRFCALATLCFAGAANGEIISSSINASTQADVWFFTDTDSSTTPSGALSSGSNILIGNTTSDLTYAFDSVAGTFSASSTITAEKSFGPLIGNNHYGGNQVILDFEVDSDTVFSMSGAWGFSNATNTGTPDLLRYELVGSSGTIFSSSTSSNSGTGSASFNESSTLAAGTYQLTFESDLYEVFNAPGIAQAGWSINSFQLTSATAIPEPGSLLFLGLISIACVTRRRR